MSVEFESYEKLHFPLALDITPVGWEVTNVESISLKIEPGFASGKQDQNESGAPHLRPMNIGRSGNVDMAVVKRVLARPEKTLEERKECTFQQETVKESVASNEWYL